MSILNKLTGAIMALALIATFGIATYAQQAAAPDKVTPKSEGFRMREGGRQHRGKPLMRFLHQLNLTDAQKDQARSILQRFKAGIEPQRQALLELRKQREEGTASTEVRERAMALRGEIREAMKGAHSELLTVLTTEQRAQYDQMVQQLKARREMRRAKRAERKALQAVPAQPPAP